MLNVLEKLMIREGHAYRRLDGETPPAQRLKIVQEYNNNDNIFVMLISTRAGGLGLNLTSANVVVIFDPNWNPSYDFQVCSCYRSCFVRFNVSWIGGIHYAIMMRLILSGAGSGFSNRAKKA